MFFSFGCEPPVWRLRCDREKDGCGAVNRASQGTGTQRGLRASATRVCHSGWKPVAPKESRDRI